MQHSNPHIDLAVGPTALPAYVLPIWKHAANNPDRAALVQGGKSLSYLELRDAVDRQARLFQSGGIEAGTPVLLLLDVALESVVAYWALHAIGAVLVVGDPAGATANLRHFKVVSSAKHVVAGSLAFEAASKLQDALIWQVATDGLVGSFTAASWLSSEEEDLHSAPPPLPEECALILFSSGTTSAPKAIAHSRGAMQALHETLIQTWKLTPDDVVLGGLPFHTIYGLIFSAASTIYSGATLVLMERFHPETALSLIQTYQVTTAAFVPAMLIMILNLAEREKFDRSSLRMVYSASAPISESDLMGFAEFSGADVLCNYGMTEIPGAAVEVSGNPHVAGSSGKVSPNFEVSVRDIDGGALPVGETGEIAMKGPTLMLGYLGDPEKTADRIRDGWIFSQDKGRVDSEGNIFVLGRMSEMIIRGGLNISPLEIESALSEHDSVADVAVVGPADRVFGQIVVAFVVPSTFEPEGNLSDALFSHCRSKLASPKVPTAFHFVSEIPRNMGGKIDRKALLNAYDDQQSAARNGR